MTIQEAIQKAVEGGWSDRLYRNLNNSQENQVAGIETHHRDMFLDPLFWQALGKSMGWKDKVCDLCGSGDYLSGFACHGGDPKTGKGNKYHCGSESAYQPNTQPPEWLYRQHRLIDHLAEGKSIEDYFKSL